MALFTKNPVRPSYLDGLGYHAGILAGVCCITGVLILMAELATRERIALELKSDQLELLEQVLPAFLYNNDITESIFTIGEDKAAVPYFVGSLNGETSVFAFESSSDGYGGAIKVLIGVNTQGEILGARVVSHMETPGLGDKIEFSKDDWITSFNGKSLSNTAENNWAVQKDGGEFDQFTGATITPRAVVKAVYNGLVLFDQNKEALLAEQESTSDE